MDTRPDSVSEGSAGGDLSQTPSSDVRFPVEAPQDEAESSGDELLDGSDVGTTPSGTPIVPEGTSTDGAGETAGTPPSAAPPPDPATLSATSGEAATEGPPPGAQGLPPGTQQRRPPPPPRRIRRGEMIGPGPATMPPKLLKRSSPKAPRAARKAEQSGVVVLEVLVDEDGKVIRTRVVSVSPPDFGFEDVAVKAARKAKYEPAMLHGVEGKMWTELRFEFNP